MQHFQTWLQSCTPHFPGIWLQQLLRTGMWPFQACLWGCISLLRSCCNQIPGKSGMQPHRQAWSTAPLSFGAVVAKFLGSEGAAPQAGLLAEKLAPPVPPSPSSNSRAPRGSRQGSALGLGYKQSLKGRIPRAGMETEPTQHPEPRTCESKEVGMTGRRIRSGCK